MNIALLLLTTGVGSWDSAGTVILTRYDLLSKASARVRQSGRLPEGFATRVGHGASEALPGGVIQRIAIARAIAGNRPVLLFDEANTRLDQRSDDQLRAYLQSLKGRCTMVLVTYRPSLTRLADRRYALDQGRLREVPA